jgi:phosphinothricin acetyltransferase
MATVRLFTVCLGCEPGQSFLTDPVKPDRVVPEMAKQGQTLSRTPGAVHTFTIAGVIHIRLATLEDVPEILEISNWAALNTPANFAVNPEPRAAWEVSWRTTHERFPWLVATDGIGRPIIGFAKASPWKGRCAYDWSAEITVYVAAERRGEGVGRSLYARLFPVLAAQGYHTALAGITLPNEASVRLHESFGMRHVGTFPQVGWKFGAWHDVGYWVALLAERAKAITEVTAPGTIRPVNDVAAPASETLQ